MLPDTRHFLHARYFATRNANVRLKDKLYLFLCEQEEPRDLMSMDILQCMYATSGASLIKSKFEALERGTPLAMYKIIVFLQYSLPD